MGWSKDLPNEEGPWQVNMGSSYRVFVDQVVRRNGSLWAYDYGVAAWRSVSARDTYTELAKFRRLVPLPEREGLEVVIGAVLFKPGEVTTDELADAIIAYLKGQE